VAPGVDGILYCKVLVPDDHVNDMHAMMQEQLKPATTLAMFEAVPACKPSTTRLIIKMETDMNGNPCDTQWTFKSKRTYCTGFAAGRLVPDLQTVRIRVATGAHYQEAEK